MDIDLPPPAASSFVQGANAPGRHDAKGCGRAIACGAGWTLVDRGDAMELQLAGAAPLPAGGGRWHVTPRGRRLTAATSHGPLIVDVTHGLCRPAGVPGDAPGSGGGFARVTLPDGRQLHGCMATTGPYPARAYPAR